ncbi:MAG: hypothetical protein WA400_02275, partial [Silvibacterium sp.]
ELVTYVIEACADTVSGVSLEARVQDIDIPFGETALEVIEEHLFAMAGGENEAAETLAGVDVR